MIIFPYYMLGQFSTTKFDLFNPVMQIPYNHHIQPFDGGGYDLLDITPSTLYFDRKS